jgi:hypothetical protein
MTDTGQNLSQQRCLLHWQREAAARCPSCNRYFCRECVTEHEGRMICSSCLSKIPRSVDQKTRSWNALFRIAQFTIGVFILWICFYYLGQILLELPTSFHDGTMWNQGFWNNG